MPRSQYRARYVAAELEMLLTKPNYAASSNEVGKLLRQEKGAEVASDLIEQVLQDNNPGEAPRLEEFVYASSD